MNRNLVSIPSILGFVAAGIMNCAFTSPGKTEVIEYYPGIKSTPGGSIIHDFWSETNSPIDITIYYKSAGKGTIAVFIDDKEQVTDITIQPSPTAVSRLPVYQAEYEGSRKFNRGMHRLEIKHLKGKPITLVDIVISPSPRIPRDQMVDPESDAGNFGLFEDSLVDHYTKWEIHEKNAKIPRYIFPAYIGSGLLGMGLDGSGMQTLDCPVGLSKRYRQMDQQVDALHLFGEGLVSDHLSPKNMMPLGYFTYDIRIDGNLISTSSGLVAHSSGWNRTIDLKKAMITTSFILDDKVQISITAFCPNGSNKIVWKVGFESTDGRLHDVVFTPQINLKVRKERDIQFAGMPLFEKVNIRKLQKKYAYLEGDVDFNGKYKPLADYKIGYLLISDNVPDYFAYEDRMGFTANVDVGSYTEMNFETCIIKLDTGENEPDHESFAERSRDFISRFDVIDAKANELDDEAFSEWIGNELDREYSDHIADWKAYHKKSGSIEVGDDKREMMFNNSLYLFRCGGTFSNGLPLCFYLHHPGGWHAATFWDLDFVTDGLIRSNDLGAVIKAAKWLDKVKQTNDRPYPWMMFYNGQSALQSDWKDTGFHVNAAHATTAVRLYEATKDLQILKDICYPIVRTVANYAAEKRFIREGDHYIGAGASGDINGIESLNDSFSAVWFVVILHKAIEYAGILNVDADLIPKWKDVADNVFIENNGEMYHVNRDDKRPGGWTSLLLYPSESMPVIDMEMFERTRTDGTAFIDQYYESGFTQPWCYFWQACSDLRLNDRPDIANGVINEGLRYIFGPGYFCEISPDSIANVGLPPYQTAHGAYLTAVSEQLIMGSIWNNDVEIFTNLPTIMKNQLLSFENLHTSNGVTASGAYSPDVIKLSLWGKGDYNIAIPVPPNISKHYDILINGEDMTDHIESNENKVIRIRVSLTGTSKLSIEVR